MYESPGAVVSLEGGWNYPETLPFDMAFRVMFEKATVTFSSVKQPAF
ncbi:hypothetical protein [Cohnella zeiphila]|uniref:Uncharacterized protein n=1 Tax=Cohnella zeiphila TaxID=2761120 RepID=A0A7X0SJX2_9BACL|nr:hypothetical protein [Cohnella zeiphila]MBB6731342.1 hypothetical protein [Cohnella zeiphila]